MFKKNLKYLFIIISLFSILVILVLFTRGSKGNPNESNINSPTWIDSALELSPERGRFALTYSVVENRSVIFSKNLALFVTPDLGYHNGKFVSLFAPGISYIILPGYLIGKYFGHSQLGSYFVITLFAWINTILIFSIAQRLSKNTTASLLAAFIFIFATPAFSYSVSLFQHHISTFLLLASLSIVLKKFSIFGTIMVWLLYGIAFTIDYPNIIIMFPVAFYSLKGILNIITLRNNVLKISIKFLYLPSILVILLPLSFLLFFNKNSYGSPFILSGTVKQVERFDDGVAIFEEKEGKKTILNLFDTSKLSLGVYKHLFGDERGTLYFTPVIILLLLALKELYIKEQAVSVLIFSSVTATILLYSMFGIGGWAFGSRYMIPAYSLMALLTPFYFIRKYNLIKLIMLTILLFYSYAVNTYGALTSNKVPPKSEIEYLEQQTGIGQKYTLDRNWKLIDENKTHSFIYNNFLKSNYNLRVFYWSVVIYVFSLSLIFIYLGNKHKEIQ